MIKLLGLPYCAKFEPPSLRCDRKIEAILKKNVMTSQGGRYFAKSKDKNQVRSKDFAKGGFKPEVKIFCTKIV